MAKNILPVNFQDDVLSEAMDGRRRYREIQNEDGTISLEDVTEYAQIGSVFGQMQINATNAAVNESADKNRIIDDQDDLAANTQDGMIAGALAVKGIEAKLSGNITTLNQKITSFESTKSEIANSALGKALGMLASWTWAQIVAALKAVANRGTLNWSGSNTTYSVPAGYYAGGTLDSRASYTNGYNAGVVAGKATNKKVTGSFTSGTYNTTSTINTGLTKIDAFMMSLNENTRGFAYWCSDFGAKGVRGDNFECSLSVSGGTITYTATNSNWINKTWTYVAFGS